jgi:hypothetical protein
MAREDGAASAKLDHSIFSRGCQEKLPPWATGKPRDVRGITAPSPHSLRRPRRQSLCNRLAHLCLDSRDPVVYNRRMVLGSGQAVGGNPLRHEAIVIGVGMENIP